MLDQVEAAAGRVLGTYRQRKQAGLLSKRISIIVERLKTN